MFRPHPFVSLLRCQALSKARESTAFAVQAPIPFSIPLTGTRNVYRRHYSNAGSGTADSSHVKAPQKPATKNVQGSYKVETYISKLNDPWTNLAFEEWLFRNSDPTTYILFLYRNSKSVIIGRNQNPWKECNLKLMARDGVPFVRRKSGGGTVYHDMGNTNYSIMMPRDVFDRRTNVDLICRALHELDIPAIVNERHDIYLKVNKSSLITKGVASVRSPVTRLRESSFTIDHLSFCEATRTEFLKRYSFDRWRQNLEGEPVMVDEAMVERMEGVKKIRDDMKTWEWMFGQTPEFSYRLEKDFSWGSIDMTIKSKEGLITDVDVTSIDPTINAQSLPLTALGIGMEGQRYDQQGIDLAVERIMYEAPEVLVPPGAAEKLKDVVQWLKEEL
ncbi:Biotin/lipoate A/B protein ligase [Mortierella alpina]|nr:Biotin/lipoate A/B protein ligase [Mortierella alpina]